MTNKEKLLKIAKPDTKDSGIDDKIFLENWEYLRNSQDIALKIILKLKELGMTKLDLAEKMNVKPQVVNRWLSGKENFTFESLTKFEEVLEIKYEN